MARRASTQPTDAELEILRVLWEKGPSMLGDVCNAIRVERNAATTTIATTLGVMRRKNLVRRTNGPRGYVWSAAIDRGVAATRAVRKLIDRVFDGSAGEMVSHLIDTGSLKDKDLAEIQRLMDEYRSAANRNAKDS